MAYLLNTTEKWRVETESEAKFLIENAKEEKVGNLTGYSSTYKSQKKGGELLQEWYEVTLKREFNIAKEPDTEVSVTYEVE